MLSSKRFIIVLQYNIKNHLNPFVHAANSPVNSTGGRICKGIILVWVTEVCYLFLGRVVSLQFYSSGLPHFTIKLFIHPKTAFPTLCLFLLLRIGMWIVLVYKMSEMCWLRKPQDGAWQLLNTCTDTRLIKHNPWTITVNPSPALSL